MTINTWKDIFKAKGLKLKDMPVVDVSKIPVADRMRVIKQTNAQYILEVCISYLNDGWIPDFTNTNQWKYQPIFEVKADAKHPSGFGLVYDYYSHWASATFCGVRLMYKDLETLKKGVKILLPLYEDLYLPGKK